MMHAHTQARTHARVECQAGSCDRCAVVCLGNAPIDEDSPDFVPFRDALTAVTADLAKRLVRDGEGATKFVTVRVEVRRVPLPTSSVTMRQMSAYISLAHTFLSWRACV
jgi:N-acetylglutamate synthase/N-acetylornithine aminotransferase